MVSPDEKNVDESGARKGFRSPGYPSMSLQEAMARLEEFYKCEGKAPAPRDIAVKAFGYKGVSGPALRALSALAQYGLLEKAGNGVKVSSLGLRLLHPINESEFAEAKKTAALSPHIFSDIIQEFEGQLPSDSSLEANLVRNRNFSHEAAQRCVQALKATLEFANIDHRAILPLDSESPPQPEPKAQEMTNQPIHPLVAYAQSPSYGQSAEWSKVFTWPLSDSTTAALSISGDRPTADDLALLKEYLEIATKALTRAIARDSAKPSE